MPTQLRFSDQRPDHDGLSGLGCNLRNEPAHDRSCVVGRIHEADHGRAEICRARDRRKALLVCDARDRDCHGQRHVAHATRWREYASLLEILLRCLIRKCQGSREEHAIRHPFRTGYQ